MYWMHENVGVDVKIDDLHPATTQATRREALYNADILYIHMLMATQLYPSLTALNKAIPSYDRFTGGLKFPPMTVIDIDDRYDLISYLNPAFATYGHTRPDGTEMQPGDKITVFTKDKGEMVLWEDGKTYDGRFETRGRVFDAAENRARLAVTTKHLQEAALVTCSTERLKKGIQEEWAKREHDIIVYPNSIREMDFPMVELAPHKDVRILWQGGQSHHEDLFEIAESMGRLARKYPNTKWLFFGAKFSWILDAIPEAQREYIHWVPYEEHRARMAIIAHDIALCPLRRTEFNAAKSAIKFYESSMRFRPAATLGANWGPYGDEIQDGKTGLVYDNTDEFEAKLETLINNEQLRLRLGEAAREWVKQYRDADVTTPQLYEALTERLERHRHERRAILPRTTEMRDKIFER